MILNLPDTSSVYPALWLFVTVLPLCCIVLGIMYFVDNIKNKYKEKKNARDKEHVDNTDRI